MSGYLLVVDGTRKVTLEIAEKIQERVAATFDAPFVLLVNKQDLQAEWEIRDADLARLKEAACKTILTSAKTGDRVDEAFNTLVGEMLARTGAA